MNKRTMNPNQILFILVHKIKSGNVFADEILLRSGLVKEYHTGNEIAKTPSGHISSTPSVVSLSKFDEYDIQFEPHQITFSGYKSDILVNIVTNLLKELPSLSIEAFGMNFIFNHDSINFGKLNSYNELVIIDEFNLQHAMFSYFTEIENGKLSLQSQFVNGKVSYAFNFHFDSICWKDITFLEFDILAKHNEFEKKCVDIIQNFIQNN